MLQKPPATAAPVAATVGEGHLAAGPPDTRVPARWLLFGRVVWVALAAVTTGLFVMGIPATYAALRHACSSTPCLYGQLSRDGLLALHRLGISADLYAGFVLTLAILCAGVYGGLAALIFWRRSEDHVGLHVSIALLLFGAATLTGVLDSLPSGHALLRVPVALLDYLGAGLFTLFLFVSPTDGSCPGGCAG